MSFDVTQGTAQTLADKLNDALVLGLYDPAGLPVGALTLEFSDPAVTVTFPGSLGDIVRFPDVIDAVVSLIPDMHFEIRPEHKSLSISMWRGAGFTIEPTGTANVSLGLDDTLATQSLGAMDVTRIRGFAQGATEGYYALITSAEAGAADPGIGDVDGPAGATNNAIALFDGITGKAIKNSPVTIAPSGNITLPALATVDGRDISVDGATLDFLALTSTGVANIAALSALVVTGMTDGAHVWVESVRDYWVLRTSADTAVSMLIAVSPTAGRVWYRKCIPDVTWRRQDYIEIDPVAGSDEATGALGLPLKSFQEVIRRLGFRYNVSTFGAARVQTIKVLGDCNEIIVWDLGVDGNCGLRITGNLTDTFTGTIASPVAINAATNTPNQATSTWTVASNLKKLAIATISGVTYAGWIAKDLGGGAARLSPWTQFVGTYVGITPSIGNAVAGNPVAIKAFTGRLNSLYIRCANSNGILIDSLEVYSTLTCAPTGAQLHFHQCLISAPTIRIGHGQVYFNACGFPNAGGNFSGNDGPATVSLQACAVFGNLTFLPRSAEPQLAFHTLFQGATMTQTGGTIRLGATGNGVAFFDCTADCVTAVAFARVRISGSVWGSGNTQYGIRLQGDCSMVVDSGQTQYLVATLGDFCFGRASGLPATTTVARAFDDSLGAFATARTLSFANLIATYTAAGSGFGGCINDQLTNCRVTVN